jgi:hypothetical protein
VKFGLSQSVIAFDLALRTGTILAQRCCLLRPASSPLAPCIMHRFSSRRYHSAPATKRRLDGPFRYVGNSSFCIQKLVVEQERVGFHKWGKKKKEKKEGRWSSCVRAIIIMAGLPEFESWMCSSNIKHQTSILDPFISFTGREESGTTASQAPSHVIVGSGQEALFHRGFFFFR